MIGEWRPGVLGPLHHRADALVALLHGLGMPVGTIKVPESDAMHKLVHSMSQQARNQVLVRPEWRPDYDGTRNKEPKPAAILPILRDELDIRF